MHRAFRHSQKVTRLIRRDRRFQRARIRQPNVLAREANNAPRDIQRVFAAFQHPRQPVHRRVRVGIAHRLVQRADEVIVPVALLVVEQRPPRRTLRDRLRGHMCLTVLIQIGIEDDHFQRR